MLLDATHEIALKLRRRLQTLGAHAGTTLGTLLPTRLGTLVAAYVHILAGKERYHLVEYVFKKLECGVITGTKDVRLDTPHLTMLERTAGA